MNYGFQLADDCFFNLVTYYIIYNKDNNRDLHKKRMGT